MQTLDVLTDAISDEISPFTGAGGAFIVVLPFALLIWTKFYGH
jgi:hypothetical protein